MSTERQTVLLLDDDPAIIEGLALGLQREGRTVITCGDLESAQMIVESGGVSDVVTDVRLSSPFAFEGLDFIHHVLNYSPESRIVLMTGNGSPEMQREAVSRGASAFLNKPFDIEQLESLLNDPPDMAGAEIVRIPTIEDILRGNDLSPAFQPIVRMGADTHEIFAWESLARLRSDTLFRNPERLFQYAFRKNRLVDLELTCFRNSVTESRQLGPDPLLFLNIHPVVFSRDRRLAETIFEIIRRAGVAPERLVLEITEQSSMEAPAEWIGGIEKLAEAGVRFAFDDVGVAYSHLMYIEQIKPEFLKISQQFGTGFESDPTRQKIVRNIVSLAGDFGSTVILEGIESQRTCDAALEMGIIYGQGYFFGRPAAASEFSV